MSKRTKPARPERGEEELEPWAVTATYRTDHLPMGEAKNHTEEVAGGRGSARELAEVWSREGLWARTPNGSGFDRVLVHQITRIVAHTRKAGQG